MLPVDHGLTVSDMHNAYLGNLDKAFRLHLTLKERYVMGTNTALMLEINLQVFLSLFRRNPFYSNTNCLCCHYFVSVEKN